MSILTVAALSATLLTQTPAEQAAIVIHPGDSEMSCDALAVAVNDLAGAVREQQARAENGRNARRAGRGLLTGLARGANMFGYRSTEGAVAAVAVTAAAGAADEAASAPAPERPATVEQQRLDHLTRLHASRC